MANTPTPHNSAVSGDIAATVLMSGDPLRAKMIAEKYLDNAVRYNEIRGMYGYTGTRNGKRYSVQGHGMGIPSIGIYSYELFNFYGVETIIRLGTCGALSADVKLGTLVIAERAVTDSNYGYQFDLPEGYHAEASPQLVKAATASAERLGLPCMSGLVCSSDIFYNKRETMDGWAKDGVIGVEMESYGLYVNAYAAKKKAITILSVSDNIVTGEGLTPLERQEGLHNMIKLAFEMA